MPRILAVQNCWTDPCSVSRSRRVSAPSGQSGAISASSRCATSSPSSSGSSSSCSLPSSSDSSRNGCKLERSPNVNEAKLTLALRHRRPGVYTALSAYLFPIRIYEYRKKHYSLFLADLCCEYGVPALVQVSHCLIQHHCLAFYRHRQHNVSGLHLDLALVDRALRRVLLPLARPALHGHRDLAQLARLPQRRQGHLPLHSYLSTIRLYGA